LGEDNGVVVFLKHMMFGVHGHGHRHGKGQMAMGITQAEDQVKQGGGADLSTDGPRM
jgi:hypothetical protein